VVRRANAIFYPNLLLTLHPDYVLTVRLWPVAPDCTRVIGEGPPGSLAPGCDIMPHSCAATTRLS
jgi:hypothetical protein